MAVVESGHSNRIESNSYFSIPFDSKRAQLFEIFEYLRSPISYLFKQNDADFYTAGDSTSLVFCCVNVYESQYGNLKMFVVSLLLSLSFYVVYVSFGSLLQLQMCL